ncbi:hypothetical protein, partial [Dysosmobacter welbionis]|uniref:hypothetical protein n=1 Tax=Dysosmobacter welbionis TaxID=2093857 RepID=UPI00300E93F8
GGQLLRRDPLHAAAVLFHALGHQNRAGRRRGAFRAGDGHPLPAAGWSWNREDGPRLRLAVSAFSGVCAGLFGIRLPIVAYLQRTARDYSEFKASMCFLFFGENAVRVATDPVTDLFTGPVLLFALASVPAAVLAMGLAAWLGPRLEEEKLQKGAIVLFLLGRRQHHREVRGIPYISSGKRDAPVGVG